MCFTGHHEAKSPSDGLVNIWDKLRSTALFHRTREGSKVAKGVLSLQKQEALVKGIIFPVRRMQCKENGTGPSSTLQRSKEGASTKNRISLVPKVNLSVFSLFLMSRLGGSPPMGCDQV
jgi:hypothetical protein